MTALPLAAFVSGKNLYWTQILLPSLFVFLFFKVGVDTVPPHTHTQKYHSRHNMAFLRVLKWFFMQLSKTREEKKILVRSLVPLESELGVWISVRSLTSPTSTMDRMD